MAKNFKTPKTNGPSPDKTEALKAQSLPTAKPSPAKSARAHVSLQLVNQTASKVCVAGTFNEWKPEATPLTRTAEGQWTGDLAVKPGRYEYLFVVDGQWLPDPKAKETVPNPFGGRNSVLVVSA